MAELSKLDLGKIIPSFTVGTVTVDETGSNPAVTTTVENGVDVTLDFKFPKGDKGDKGAVFTPAVAANGDLTWTNDGGLTNPAMVNVKGKPGSAYKPTVNEDTGQLTWEIVDNPTAITQQVNIKGPQGPAGRDLMLVKIYDSVAKMNEDVVNAEIPVGSMVVVNVPVYDEHGNKVVDDRGNVVTDLTDPDNATMWIKTETGYQFVSDLSGKEGIQGPSYYYTPAVNSNGVLSWTNNAPQDAGLVNPPDVNLKGDQGDAGLSPRMYVDTTEGSPTYGHLFASYDPDHQPAVYKMNLGEGVSVE